MDEMILTITGENGEELSFQVEQIFAVEGTAQLYCAAAHGNEVLLFRCDLRENGDETEVSVSDITDPEEFEQVAAAYQEQAAEAAAQSATEELAAFEDFMTLVDTNGKEHSFIAHLIFADEISKREYIAVQEVSETGDVAEEIFLYRIREGKDRATVEMIPSDMEYERARNIFMSLIEQ